MELGPGIGSEAEEAKDKVPFDKLRTNVVSLSNYGLEKTPKRHLGAVDQQMLPVRWRGLPEHVFNGYLLHGMRPLGSEAGAVSL